MAIGGGIRSANNYLAMQKELVFSCRSRLHILWGVEGEGSWSGGTASTFPHCIAVLTLALPRVIAADNEEPPQDPRCVHI